MVSRNILTNTQKTHLAHLECLFWNPLLTADNILMHLLKTVIMLSEYSVFMNRTYTHTTRRIISEFIFTHPPTHTHNTQFHPTPNTLSGALPLTSPDTHMHTAAHPAQNTPTQRTHSHSSDPSLIDMFNAPHST